MLITLEGIEGSGKTTLITDLADYLSAKGHDCLITREPGGTDIGRQIRSILLHPDNTDLDPLTELLLYAADRAQHIRMLVKPALMAGKTVLCDRFFDATTVYQGYARGLDMQTILRLHEMVLEGLAPDLTLLFDLPVETGLKRAGADIDTGTRTEAETRFEKESLVFHEKVRSGYLDLARQYPGRFRRIDAAGPLADVRNSLIQTISNYLQNEE